MAEIRFRDREVTLAGITGRNLAVESANPLNYHQLVSRPEAMPRVTIDAKLFLPREATRPLPVVVIVPGSLGIPPSHLRHAETLLGLGLAACVVDPFGPRSVSSTVANQTQYSFAASTYDVIATVRALAALPEVDADRIGLQGHSRGGTAVMNAAMRGLNGGIDIAAVLAAYPWCGHQLLDPDVGTTEIRVLVGERDDWVSPMQAQAYVQAIRLEGGKASLKLHADAAHSFDRGEPMRSVPEAAVAPGAPIAFIAADGAFIHPRSGVADPALTDRDIMVYALKAGFGVKGASLGSKGDQAGEFTAEMIDFFRRTLLGR